MNDTLQERVELLESSVTTLFSLLDRTIGVLDTQVEASLKITEEIKLIREKLKGGEQH